LEGLIGAVHGREQPQPDSSSRVTLGTVAHPFHPERFEKAFLDEESRMKHVYILGATGSGKTKLIESMIQQDIRVGRGFGLLDLHGDLSQNILKHLAFLLDNRDRAAFLEYLSEKLILIEPFNQQGVIGFNPLEAKRAPPFSVAVELMAIFKKVWQGSHWGPRMEELLRNLFLTLSENGLTLLEAPLLLTDSSFRDKMVQGLAPGEAREYWLCRFNPLSESMKSVFREPVLNRISVFTTDPAVRLMIGQVKSTIDFRQIMDQGKWLIINLAKGHLRENIYLLGGLLIAKLKLAGLSRVDMPEQDRNPFYLFIDEFQNVIGENFETILSESRKYGLSLTLSHQFLDQLPRELRSAILGNVSTEIFFRLSHHDASQISSEMDQKEKSLIEKRIIDLKTAQAYLKIKGQKPRLLKTLYVPPIQVSDEALDEVKRASFRQWARPVAEVEREIEERRSLWQRREAGERLTPKMPEAKSPGDQEPLTPEGSFEEGQNEW